jgi:hypothetical protein
VSHISSDDTHPRFRTIVRLPTFERSVQGLLTEEEQRYLELWLALDPRAGAVVSGTGGVRKSRFARSGRGKRGGVRIIHYYHAARELVFLILAYAKTEQESLSMDEKRRMRQLIHELEADR